MPRKKILLPKVKVVAEYDELIVYDQTIHQAFFELEIPNKDMHWPYFVFMNCILFNFPRHSNFRFGLHNLTHMKIYNSKLTRIVREDLNGFDHLVELNLDFNEIETLNSNLFTHVPNLEHISIKGNKIKVIGKDILKPLQNLKTFNLRFNTNISVLYDPVEKPNFTLDSFEKAINKCMSTKEVWSIVCKKGKQIRDLEKEIKVLKENSQALEKKLEETKHPTTNCNLDFTIKVNQTEFKTQKEIVTANSPFLAKLINQNGNSDTLKLKDISEEALEHILVYMHTKQPPKPTANFLELYETSGRLQMKELMDLCADNLTEKVTPENSLQILILCEKFKNVKLQMKAYDEYKKNI